MHNDRQIRVSLQPGVADAARQAVDSGAYQSVEDVVHEALIEWRLRRELDPDERDALCRLWDEGIANGPGRFNSIDEIRQEARRRLASGNNRG